MKFTTVGHVLIRAARDGDSVTLSVSDTGCGIDPAVLPDIFDAFVQSDDFDHARPCRGGSGTGCGAATGRTAGRADRRSKATQATGSAFTITLPLPALEAQVDSAPTTAPDDAQVPRPACWSSMTIRPIARSRG